MKVNAEVVVKIDWRDDYTSDGCIPQKALDYINEAAYKHIINMLPQGFTGGDLIETFSGVTYWGRWSKTLEVGTNEGETKNV
jgi:hypothetical protein